MDGGGWLPDPWGRHEFRYRDGRVWTEHVRDGDTPATDFSHATTPVPYPAAPAGDGDVPTGGAFDATIAETPPDPASAPATAGDAPARGEPPAAPAVPSWWDGLGPERRLGVGAGAAAAVVLVVASIAQSGDGPASASTPLPVVTTDAVTLDASDSGACLLSGEIRAVNHTGRPIRLEAKVGSYRSGTLYDVTTGVWSIPAVFDGWLGELTWATVELEPYMTCRVVEVVVSDR